MTSSDKRLYHQIHPVKLFTDMSTAAASTYLLWKHLLWPAVLLAIVPSVVVSATMITAVDLEPYKNSPLGHYVKKYLDYRVVDAIRFFGFGIVAFAGWYHSAPTIVVGAMIIAACWTRGLLFSASSAATKAEPPEAQ